MSRSSGLSWAPTMRHRTTCDWVSAGMESRMAIQVVETEPSYSTQNSRQFTCHSLDKPHDLMTSWRGTLALRLRSMWGCLPLLRSIWTCCILLWSLVSFGTQLTDTNTILFGFVYVLIKHQFRKSKKEGAGPNICVNNKATSRVLSICASVHYIHAEVIMSATLLCMNSDYTL